jgi:O-antigen/teichoic acid export membrane protein
VLTGWLLTQATAGWLAAAYRIITIPLFIPTLITVPLLPALSRVLTDGAEFQRVLRHSLVAALLLAIPCAAGIVSLAPAVPHFMHWPGEFSHSIPLMRILAFQQPLMAADMVLGTALVALNSERPWLRVLVIGAMFNPALNIVFLPLCNLWFHNGAIGAAFVEVATELIMFIGALVLIPAGMVDRGTWSLIGRAIAGGAVLCLVASVLQERSVPLAILAGGCTYVLAIFLLRALKPSDVHDLWHVVANGRGRRTAGVID